MNLPANQPACRPAVRTAHTQLRPPDAVKRGTHRPAWTDRAACVQSIHPAGAGCAHTAPAGGAVDLDTGEIHTDWAGDPPHEINGMQSTNLPLLKTGNIISTRSVTVQLEAAVQV